ncbi:hypothetical protein LSTR_LSTR007302, partial [Laodelphax striatellus]
MISVKREQFQDDVPQEYVEFVVENDENFINIQEVYDEQDEAPAKRRSGRKRRSYASEESSGNAAATTSQPQRGRRRRQRRKRSSEEEEQTPPRSAEEEEEVVMATVLSSGGAGGGGEMVVTAAALQSSVSSQQQQQDCSAAVAAITVVAAAPPAATTALLQNGKIETVLGDSGDSSDGSTIQVTVSAGGGGGGGGGDADSDGGGSQGGGGGGTTAIVDSAHYITVTVPDTEAVTGDGVAHSAYVQYVESTPDQTIYTTTNGQMAYPVYTVGESGTMYTPASGQYYTPGNTTPVTYSQVTAGSLNGQTQGGAAAQLLSSTYLIQQTVDGTDTIIASNRSSPQTVSAVQWLLENYETAEGVSLARVTLYNHYLRHCYEHKLDPVNAASFGKLIRSVFLGLRTRRLGT